MCLCADLVLSCTDELIENVNETRRINKALLSQGLLTEDKYRTIAAASSSQDRMKQLLHALASKGQQGRQALYRLLQEHEPELTLQLGRLCTKANFPHCISLFSILQWDFSEHSSLTWLTPLFSCTSHLTHPNIAC